MSFELRALEGKYQIVEKIREGGMGAIYKVRHRLLDEVRVIKVMKPQLKDDAAFAERFLREARAASQLRHGNIAQLYDFSVDEDGTAYMVMEFIEGKNLAELLREGQPPVGLVLEIAVQALRALALMHAKNFVHRDISPDNLMIARGPDGELVVKLIDLGIAKSLGEQAFTQTGEFLGKFHYASPEHFGGAEGTSTVEPRSDLYSFGIVLYELLTGERPFRGKDFSALTASHLFHAPAAFEDTQSGGRVPAELRAIVLRALAKRPEERFADADDMRRALEAVASSWAQREADLQVAQTMLMAAAQRDSAEAPTVAKGGSTQERLDRQFPQHTGPTGPVAAAVRPAAATVAPAAPPGSTEATLLAPPPAAPRGGHRLPWAVAAVLALALLGVLGAALLSDRRPERPQLPATAAAGPSVEPPAPGEQWTIEAAAGGTQDTLAEAPAGPQVAAGAAEQRLAAMRASFDDVLRLGEADYPPAVKAEAWRRFLAAYGEDLPGSLADDELRTEAARQLARWEAARPARPVQEAPAPPVVAAPVAPAAPPAPAATPEAARAELARRNLTRTAESLEAAVASGDAEEVRLLLLAGGPYDLGGSPGRKLVERAVGGGQFGIADQLLEAGARPPGDLMEDAAGDGDVAVVRFLHQRRLGNGDEALEEALDAVEWRTAQYLASAGVSLANHMGDAEDMLVEAAERGDAEAVSWLLSAGVDARGGVGKDALDEAEDNGHQAIVQMLRRARGE